MNAELIVKAVIAKLVELCPPIARAWHSLAAGDPIERNHLIDAMIAVADEEMRHQQAEFAQFCLFWGKKYHSDNGHNMAFGQCLLPFCQSFRETIHGLGHQVALLTNLDSADAPASVPHRP